jgi:5'-nucleotidase (lipoprotein e(P4) family)
LFSTELYALLSEILVGSATVATICLVVWLVKCKSDLRFVHYFREKIDLFLEKDSSALPHWRRLDRNQTPSSSRESHRESLLYPVIGSVVLGLGLAVQSAVDDLIDHHSIAIRSVASLVQIPFPSKDAFRFSAFYNRTEPPPFYLGNFPRKCSPDTRVQYELSLLGREVFQSAQELVSPAIPILFEGGEAEKQLWRDFLRGPGDFLNVPDSAVRETRCKLVTGIAYGVYYDGNNWAHRNEPGVSALRRWQIQIDTLGSVTLLSIIIFAATSAYSITSSLRQSPLKTKRHSARWWLACSAIVAPFCLYGYVTGMKNYTGRAVGMYSSAHHNDDIKLSIKGCHSLVRLLPETLNQLDSGLDRVTTSPWCTKAIKSEETEGRKPAQDATTSSEIPWPPRELHWYRNSAERRAIYAQSYNLAWRIVSDRLDKPLAGRWAVVLDIDETILDNSLYQERIDKTNWGQFEPVLWSRWTAASMAPAFAPSREFIKDVRAVGGLVILVTNRKQQLCPDTERNLRNQNISFDQVLCLDSTIEEKEGRFAAIRDGRSPPGKGKIEIVVFVGDNILDCAGQKQDTFDVKLFGTQCVALPNPMYGSWTAVPYN